LQVNEVKGSIKFQLKKVLCLGVAIAHVGMEENHIRGTYVWFETGGGALRVRRRSTILVCSAF
jgi:hypothetical protein